MRELPCGWAYACLPELISNDGIFVDGDWIESKDQDPTGDIRLIQLADIGDGRYLNKSNRFLTHSTAIELGCTFLKRGDVLIARMPDPLGRACLFPGDNKQSVTVVDVCVVRGKEEHFDRSWLMHFINAPSFRADIHSLQSGSTRKRISRGNLSTLKLPVPPRAEQTRIVTKLEELLADLDVGVAELKTAQKKLAQYRQSLLKAAVEGALTAQWREDNPTTESGAQLLERILQERRARWEAKQLAKFAEQGKTPPKEWQKKYPEPVQPDTTDLPPLPEGWVWASLEQISEIQGGIQKQPSRVPKENKYPFLRVANVARGKLKLDDVHDIELFTGELERLALVAGDILIVEGNGSLAEIGRCAVWDGSIENAVHQNHLIRVRPIIVNSQFVETWVNSLGGIDKLTKLAVTTSGLYTLSVKKISKIPVPIAPLTEQESATQTLIESLSALYLQEQSIELSLKQCAAQRQNILRAAFAGQLVPQDPTDEPASRLLERIRVKRAEQAKQPKPRKTKKKESSTVARKLVDVLTEAGDWLPAQEAFRRCGIADGAQTEEIEALYAELRVLDKSQNLSVKAVFDLVDTPEGKKHRKVADHLKWVG
ncbi:restriction endonuclease subunit S [Dickeya ananatis]|uniref:restriction endonuclease subunit S n=1 Tax=Dickeya ananatis TaxID=3061286 RepID=UPI00388DED4D